MSLRRRWCVLGEGFLKKGVVLRRRRAWLRARLRSGLITGAVVEVRWVLRRGVAASGSSEKGSRRLLLNRISIRHGEGEKA